MFGMLDNWQTVARRLESKFQCILVDLRNHGKSPRHADMNYPLMATDVNELIESLKLDSVMMLGHSMGGKTAMQFAFNYPEKTDRLIIVDISPKQYPPHHEAVINAIRSITPSELKDRSQAAEHFKEHLGDEAAMIQFMLKNLARKPEGGFKWKANMPVLIDHYDDLMAEVTSSETFNKPTLFIRGERSHSVLDEDWTQITSLFPDSQLITIPGAGHWVHADEPEGFIDALIAFIET